MKEKTLMCQIEMFSLDQTIYEIIDGKMNIVGRVSLEELPSGMVNYCANSDTHKIHLYGNEVYVSEIADYIEALTKMNYDFNDIIVEVN